MFTAVITDFSKVINNIVGTVFALAVVIIFYFVQLKSIIYRVASIILMTFEDIVIFIKLVVASFVLIDNIVSCTANIIKDFFASFIDSTAIEFVVTFKVVIIIKAKGFFINFS